MAIRNYVFILFCVIFIICIIISSVKKIPHIKHIRIILQILCSVLSVVFVLTVIIFPDLSAVETTGQYEYTYLDSQLEDNSRTEVYSEKEGSRKLSVRVYYPTGEFIEDKSCSLVIYSPGGISTKTANESLFRELASHKYIVISVDHTYQSLSTVIDGKRLWIDGEYMRELQEEDSYLDIDNSYECYKKWMDIRIADINFVIDSVLNKPEDSGSFYSLINPDSIGLVGHSLGGAAALGTARVRQDIKAVIALESPYFSDIQGVSDNAFVWNTEPYSCAIMNIYSDNGYPLIDTDNKYKQNKNYKYNEGNVEYYHIEGSNHFTLTDLVRMSPLLSKLLGGNYTLSGYDTLSFINEKALNFFGKYLS